MEYLTLTIECDTIRVSISSRISFSSYPPGADIYVTASGGIPAYTGLKTPNIIYLPIGSYDYILKLTGFENYTDTTTVNTGEITFINANLTPIPTLAPVLIAAGSLSILGLILATSAKQAIPITTGILGGNIVAVKL